MKAKKQTELQLLENCRLILNNFKEVPIIREKMSELGYNDARMQHGAKLYENAMRLYEINKNETARHRVAYDKLSADFASLKKSYSRDRKIAKVALRNYPELWHYLSINGSSSRSNLKLISDMETFYTNAIDIPEIKSLLAKYKIDRAKTLPRIKTKHSIKCNFGLMSSMPMPRLLSKTTRNSSRLSAKASAANSTHISLHRKRGEHHIRLFFLYLPSIPPIRNPYHLIRNS